MGVLLMLMNMVGNFAVALTTFILLGKPSMLEGWLARLTGEYESWQQGMLSAAAIQRLHHMGSRLGRLLLVVLFCWSFLTGLMLRWQGGFW